MLIGFTIMAITALTVELFGPEGVAPIARLLVGFTAWVMCPFIFSLALNSVAGHHRSFAVYCFPEISAGCR